jgi:large subunit ribosomal protein L5e
MPFVKVVKNRSYFRRFQVKYRRRREGVTDYRARRAMTLQDKTKYNTPKYRLIVRISNRDVVAQIAYAKIQGDEIMASAYSHELHNYGAPKVVKGKKTHVIGATNYAACYATGLLVARRVLSKLGLADKYEGQKAATGDKFLVKEDEERRPFKAILDVGLARTTTGARIFGAMKGACDGGVYCPHNETRFPGYDSKKKAAKPQMVRDRIFGKHVGDYMKALQTEDAEAYAKKFGQYIKAGIKPEAIEGVWKKVHDTIRKDPIKKSKAKGRGFKPKKDYKTRPLTLVQRQNNAKNRVRSFAHALHAAAE